MTPRGGEDRGRGVNYWFEPPESALRGQLQLLKYKHLQFAFQSEPESIDTDPYCATNDTWTLRTVKTE